MGGESELIELLRDVKDDERLREREAMSFASVGAYVAAGKDLQHSSRRHQAQVDAMLKCKYGDLYEPPEQSPEDMATLINCKVIGDEAITAITDALKGVGSGDDAEPQKKNEQPQEPKPPPAKPSNGNRDNTLAKAALIGAGILGVGGLGSAATYLSMRHLDAPTVNVQDPSIYDIRATPYDPNWDK